ncbi:hypothetical protein F2P81_008281 [Scophthalmus maximus]|uniref:Uncharacterized protein n=1 Tax=Scophthalmus maximus TaxID=52904 RepID=A0A6A4SXT7_SCOMX|nr:hypothetical protein F2P81_008281 [Scophthalmus maximus]
MLLLAFLNLTSPHSIKPVCSPDFLQLPQSSSTDPREPARLVSSHCGIHVRAERAGRKAAAFRGERAGRRLSVIRLMATAFRFNAILNLL